MLKQISIKNYAIIERLEIQLSTGLNIITGETGAGKSILLGALSLILGERADTKSLYNQEEKCIIEADFDIDKKLFQELFVANEIDFEKHTIIRREILPSGKSRSFINDTPVNLSVLRIIGEKLVNMHNQHETLELIRSGFQMEVVDVLAKNQPLLNSFSQDFARYKKEQKQLDELVLSYQRAKTELDFLSFQLKELMDANLDEAEQEILESEQKTLSNVEEIQKALQASLLILDSSEISVLDSIGNIQIQLRSVKNLNRDIENLSSRLVGVAEELKDISKEFEDIQDSVSVDPERLAEVQQRLNVIYRLQKKYNVQTVDALLKIKADVEQKINAIDGNSSQIEMLTLDLDKQRKLLLKTAELLHKNREGVLVNFQKEVMGNLHKIGMPNATFIVQLQKQDEKLLHSKGLSEIKFLFSANKGFAPQEIKEVASGGELSRLMLCIKSLVADVDALPTLVFDEIDAGISGEVALKVSDIMKKMSRQHQLICITHLPQIARTADKHFYIYKETKGAKTNTRIKVLENDERVLEIAKMLGGDKVSEAALANAKELMNV